MTAEDWELLAIVAFCLGLAAFFTLIATVKL